MVLFVTTVLAGAGVFLLWQHGQPRRIALQPVARLAFVLTNPRGSELLDAVVLPSAVRGRTPAEQTEFLTKALTDELSVEGVVALKRHAQFGPLKSIFPDEAAAWCQQAGVNVDDCVAFKLDRNGLRAEVVLVKRSTLNSPAATERERGGQHSTASYGIVRCNNVKQMAAAKSP